MADNQDFSVCLACGGIKQATGRRRTSWTDGECDGGTGDGRSGQKPGGRKWTSSLVLVSLCWSDGRQHGRGGGLVELLSGEWSEKAFVFSSASFAAGRWRN